MTVEVRAVESDADVEAWLHVRRVVLPNESAGTVEQQRARMKPEQLLLLADLDGGLAGSGIGGLSDAPGRAFVAPRSFRSAPPRLGRVLLARLGEHVERPASIASAPTWATRARRLSRSGSASGRSTASWSRSRS